MRQERARNWAQPKHSWSGGFPLSPQPSEAFSAPDHGADLRGASPRQCFFPAPHRQVARSDPVERSLGGGHRRIDVTTANRLPAESGRSAAAAHHAPRAHHALRQTSFFFAAHEHCLPLPRLPWPIALSSANASPVRSSSACTTALLLSLVAMTHTRCASASNSGTSHYGGIIHRRHSRKRWQHGSVSA